MRPGTKALPSAPSSARAPQTLSRFHQIPVLTAVVTFSGLALRLLVKSLSNSGLLGKASLYRSQVHHQLFEFRSSEVDLPGPTSLPVLIPGDSEPWLPW